MTLIDAIIILIVLGGLVLGYRKGFIGQLSSLVSWVVAMILCYKCGDLAKDLFLTFVPSAADWPLSSITVKTVSLAFTFLIVMVIIRLLMRLFKGSLNAVHLGFIDKAGGSLLFMFKYAFVLSILLNLLYAFNPDMETFGTMHMLNLKLYRDLIEPVPTE